MASASPGFFVPYGWLPVEYKGPFPKPKGFLGPAGGPGTDAEWLSWVEATADDLKAFLWPRWTGSAWDGDLVLAERLTRADLSLMPALRKELEQPIRGGGILHKVLFVAEDLTRPSLGCFLDYLAAVPPGVLARFDELLGEGGGERGLPAALELKLRMQRPRPYQTAYLLDPATLFEYEVATTAVTPSLVSGHSLQGAMALATVVVRLEHELRQPLPPALVTEMQRFFIHIGDRRVYAGVHYPSDNVSSWFTVLRLLRNMAFDTPEDPANTARQQARARAVLWGAIEQHSQVWKAILGHAATDGSPFAAVAARLRAEGG